MEKDIIYIYIYSISKPLKNNQVACIFCFRNNMFKLYLISINWQEIFFWIFKNFNLLRYMSYQESTVNILKSCIIYQYYYLIVCNI